MVYYTNLSAEGAAVYSTMMCDNIIVHYDVIGATWKNAKWETEKLTCFKGTY